MPAWRQLKSVPMRVQASFRAVVRIFGPSRTQFLYRSGVRQVPGLGLHFLLAIKPSTGPKESGVAQSVSPQNPSGVRSGHSNCVAPLDFLRARGRGVVPCGTARAHSRAVSVGTAERAVRELARKAEIK